MRTLIRNEQDLSLRCDDDEFGSYDMLVGVFSNTSGLLVLTEEGKEWFELIKNEAIASGKFNSFMLTCTNNYLLEELISHQLVEYRLFHEDLLES